MRALIVVESWFGSTRAIARAVADGLGRFMTVEVSEVGDAPSQLAPDVDLVVVGGPTHAFGMSRPNTRRDAARQAGVTTDTERGIREWLASSPTGIQRAAAFDTRTGKGWVPRSAVRGILLQLRRLGATLIAGPQSFSVTGTEGPLAPGELDRARRWGEQLGRAVTAITSTDRSGWTPSR
jgi:hypothetical protein